ncbi:organomercurial lyase [Thermoflexus hugenholtzii]
MAETLDPEHLAHRLMMELSGRGWALDRGPLFEAALRLLARGEPVPLDRLAEAVGWPVEAVRGALQGDPAVEWDEAGRLIGWGLTLRPTPFRLELEGRSLWTWCALDTLLFPLCLEREARVEASCARTGQPIRFTISPAGIREIEPAEAVLVLAAPGPGAGIRAAFCQRTVFLASPRLFQPGGPWDPVLALLPLPEAFHLARRLGPYLQWEGGIGCCAAIPDPDL